jgi:TonB family protein
VRRLPAGLLLSLAVHAALVLGVAAAVSQTSPPMLFVDLVHGFGLTHGGGSGGGGSSGEPAREAPAPRPAPAPSHRRAAARTRAAAPAESAAPRANVPVTPRASAPAAPRAPEPARAMPAPDLIVEPVAPPPSPEVRRAPEPSSATSSPAPAAAPPAPSATLPGATTEASAGVGAGSSATDASARARDGAEGLGPPGAGGRERGPRAGQGGSGSGGGLGAGVGTRQGSAVAMIPGDGAGLPPEYEGYYALLRSRIHEAIRYPGVARRRGISGRVEIVVRVTSAGLIETAEVVASSSHDLLDEAALEAARGLRVPFPPGVRPRALSMRLPVDFVLR